MLLSICFTKVSIT